MRKVPLLLVFPMVVACLGCGRERRETQPPLALAVRVLDDTSAADRLRITPPDTTRVWLARVSRDHLPASEITRPERPEPPLPDAQPDSLYPEPPPLEVDGGLKPPILRVPVECSLPVQARGRPVELDVRVDETGAVTEAQWAGGSSDSALVRAARSCALKMRFYPALRAGRPVAVWCRQRFDFRARR